MQLSSGYQLSGTSNISVAFTHWCDALTRLSANGSTLDGTDDLIAGGRDTEHAKGMLEGSLLSLDRCSGTAILEGVDLVPVLVGSAHGTLDAAVGKESTEDDVLDPVLTEEEIQVGRVEAAKAGLALADEVGRAGLHRVTKSGTPLVGLEGLALLDGLEDSKVTGDLLVTVLKGDGHMNDGTAGHPGGVHRFLRVGDGAILVKAGLDCLIESTTLGGELILVLNKYQSSLGGIQFVNGHVEGCARRGGGVSLGCARNGREERRCEGS